MGAWGAGSFENDDAMDWVSDLSESSDWSAVQSALDHVLLLGANDYLEAPEASVALAAAEVVAARVGAPAGERRPTTQQMAVWQAGAPQADAALLAIAPS